MQSSPHLPRRRSPTLNALVVGAIVLILIVAGAIVWTNWSRSSVTAVGEAHEAVVQPVETTIPPAGVQPARAPAN